MWAIEAGSRAARDAIMTRIKTDKDEFRTCVREKEYQVAGDGDERDPLDWLHPGGVFEPARRSPWRTMYAAVASRARDRHLRPGFSRRSILVSFLFESVVLCLLGGVLGCLVTLPFNGMTSGTQNMMMFSEVTFSFHFGPRVLLQGILLAMVMGVLGGFAPAWRAVRMNIVQALRERE